MIFKIIVIFVLLSSPALAGQKAVSLPESQILRAILGEAIGESQEGKEAVARTILNRKSLKGVYGLNNPVIKKASPKDWANAREALRMAKLRDVTHGAKGWGNANDLVIFRQHAWFRNCVIVVHIGNHWFYK